MNGGRSILVALVAAALAWAYLATHRPGAPGGHPEAQVSVWSAPPASISRVVYHEGERGLTITPDWAADKDNPYLWVEAVAPKSAPTSQANPLDGPRQNKLGGFKGNAAAETTLKLLANLRGKRALGRADKLDLALYELAENRRYVELVFEDGRAPWRLDFGRSTLGNVLRYVRAHTNDTVYLVRDNLTSSLAGDARRLFDRQVFPFAATMSKRIEIDFAGRTHTLYQVTGPGRRNVFWATKPDAEEGDTVLTRVATQVSRVLAESYAPREQELPAAPKLEVRLFRQDGGKSESAWLKVFPGGDESELAVSSYTRYPVNIRQQVVNELIGSLRELPKAE